MIVLTKSVSANVKATLIKFEQNTSSNHIELANLNNGSYATNFVHPAIGTTGNYVALPFHEAMELYDVCKAHNVACIFA